MSLLPVRRNANVTLHEATASDFLAIAELEAHALYDDDFSALAFGPHRASRENIRLRAGHLAENGAASKSRCVKAVKEGEIVGAAIWSFENAGEGGRDGRDERRNGLEEVKGEESDEMGGWGTGSNAKFCEDAFLGADKHMMESCKGEEYGKLNSLVVDPKYQRMGIGTRLMDEGLKAVDEKGLQCVLGASKQGLGLYKRYGFVEHKTLNFKLWEYEGGLGMGEDDHCVMHRPAIGKK